MWLNFPLLTIVLCFRFSINTNVEIPNTTPKSFKVEDLKEENLNVESIPYNKRVVVSSQAKKYKNQNITYAFIGGNFLSVKGIRETKRILSSSFDSLSRSKPKPTMTPTPTTSATPTRSASPTKKVSKALSFPPNHNFPTLRSTCATSLIPSSSSPTKTITQIPSVRSAHPSSLPFEDIAYHPPRPVMTGTVNAYHIFYGDFTSVNATNTKNLVNYFAEHLGGSPWYRILSSYYQIISGVKTFVSESYVFKKSLNVAATGPILTTDDVINMIISSLNSGSFPLDVNGIYTIFFRGDIISTFDPSRSDSLSWLVDWCGYHGAFYLIISANTQVIIKFVVVGDPSFVGQTGQVCEEEITKPTANQNLGGDSMINVYAHELAGTITNYLDAWYFDSNNDENGDECFWNFGNYLGNSNIQVGSKAFLVQKMWQPGKGCVLSN